MATNSFYIEISEKNLIHNANYLKEKYNCKLLPVLKANAYGHGIKIVSSLLYKNDITEFAVARLCEAKKILENKNMKKCKILVFETINKKEYLNLDERILITANSLKDLKKMINDGVSSKQIQIKIDFGFGRNGISINEIEKLKKYIFENNLRFNGIYSHLYAVSKEEGKELIEKFKNSILFLGKERFEMSHMQNSEGILLHGNTNFFTHIRPGIYIYGIQEPGIYMENLKQVMTLKGKIDSIREIFNNKYLAYSLKEEAKVIENKNIAKIKIGYGDGFLKLNTFSYCLINNKKFIINSISMDNTFIQVNENVKVGDEVILYPNFEEVYSTLNMHIVELICLLSPRLKRIIR